MEAAQPFLHLHEGGGRDLGRHFVRVGGNTIGRAESASIRIGSTFASSHHAEVWWDESRLRARDLGSTNGTFVNGVRIDGWVDLGPGDVIRVADIDATVEFEPDSTGQASPPGWQTSSPPERRSANRRAIAQLFISHSSQDKHAARTIASYLQNRGWDVWIDEQGIKAGKEWTAELEHALESARVVVLLVTIESMRSRWVAREVSRADKLAKTIVPVLLEDVSYPKNLSMVLDGIHRIALNSLDPRELARLEDAVLEAAAEPESRPKGQVLVAIGSVLTAIGSVGAVIGFGLFAYLGATAEPFSKMDTPFGPLDPPFVGWALFAVAVIVVGIGTAIRRAGRRRGI